MWSVLLLSSALAQSPCTWSVDALQGGSFRVEGAREGDLAPLTVSVSAWGKELPAAQARFEGLGPLQVEVGDASVIVRGALAAGEGALYPTAPMSLPGGVQLDGSGAVQALSLGEDGLRVAARLANYTPTTPAEATVACEALSLVRSATPAASELPYRSLNVGTWTVLAAPGGPALGELRCEQDYGCPEARLMSSADGLSQVELRWTGARLVGWVPGTALNEPLAGILGGMLGGAPSGSAIRRYACPTADLWALSPQGQLARVGALHAGAVVHATVAAEGYAQVWPLGSGWLRAHPNALVLANADLARCEDQGPTIASGGQSAIGGLVGSTTAPSGPTQPVILGALSKEAIDAVVKDALADVRRCYKKGLRSNPKLAGRVAVKFIIEPDGTVREAAIKSSTLGDARVESCVAAEVAALRFPKPAGGGIVIVSYPFVFAPE